MSFFRKYMGYKESEDLEDEVTDVDVSADEEIEEELSDYATETTGEEEAEHIEEEMAANEEIVEGMIEPDYTTQDADIPIGIIIDPSLGDAEVEDEIADTTLEEDAETVLANGEAFMALFESEIVDDYANDHDLTHSEAREELGLTRTEIEDETPISDAIVGQTFVTNADDEGNIVVEKFDDEKSPFDYEAGSNEPFGDDDPAVGSDELFEDGEAGGEGSIPVSEAFMKRLLG